MSKLKLYSCDYKVPAEAPKEKVKEEEKPKEIENKNSDKAVTESSKKRKPGPRSRVQRSPSSG